MKLIVFLLAASLLPAQHQILRRANVIDGVSAEPIRNTTVIVRDGKIAAIGAGEAPAGAVEIDLEGKWLLPGFVDAHVHIRDLEMARRALRFGTTTARSMGVSHFVDAGLRDLHRGGLTDIPEILAAGYHVRPNPAEELYYNFPSLADLIKGVAGTQNVRRVVKANLDRGVNVIKILATERAGLPETDPRKRTFTDEELSAAVDEAKSRNIPVAAHAHGNEGAFAAVRAGVHSIEHGTYLSEETLNLMKQKGTFFVPTMAIVRDLLEPGGDYDNPGLLIRARHMYPRIRETVANAKRLGVKIAGATDTSYDTRSVVRMQQEVAELASAGLSTMEAIQAATSVSAQCLGVASRTGSIRPGLEADLVVVERDPLRDLASLQDVLLVINNGRIAVNRLKW
jgi:imidazolonepropionase-like amidohydrolase